jgi:hypothetical protein
MLPLSGSCIKGDYYIKMTPDLVITDCNEKTMILKADPCLDPDFELLPDKTDTDTYDQFWKDDGTRSRRCIVGEWFHIAAVSSFEIEVHIDENTSDTLRRVTLRCSNLGVDTEVVIIQHGYHTKE